MYAEQDNAIMRDKPRFVKRHFPGYGYAGQSAAGIAKNGSKWSILFFFHILFFFTFSLDKPEYIVQNRNNGNKKRRTRDIPSANRHETDGKEKKVYEDYGYSGAPRQFVPACEGIKITCFLADIKDFAAFNEVYARFFVSKPARSCFAVRDLPKGVLCEIEAIAVQ